MVKTNKIEGHSHWLLLRGCSVPAQLFWLSRENDNSAAAAKSLQLCPTLCDPIDGSPPGSPVPRILQARTLEWVAISFSSAWKWKVKVKSLSRVQLFATPWTAAYQAPPSMGFSRQEYWSGVPLPSLDNSRGVENKIVPRWSFLPQQWKWLTETLKGTVVSLQWSCEMS